jgi:hypothetical protein
MPKISALTAASAPDADDLLYIVEDENSRKATVEQVGKAATNATGDAPIYACRAWVNFNGTGTVAIRGSGNVSSVTDNGTGDYTVNFTTPMPDANFAAIATATFIAGTTNSINVICREFTVNWVKVVVTQVDGGANVIVDNAEISVCVFR